MTRKDYILIAHALFQAKPLDFGKGDQTQRTKQWGTTAAFIGVKLEEENPSFNWAEFNKVCNFGPG